MKIIRDIRYVVRQKYSNIGSSSVITQDYTVLQMLVEYQHTETPIAWEDVPICDEKTRPVLKIV